MFQGESSGEVSDEVKNLKLQINVQMFNERKRQNKSLAIAEKMNQMGHNLPNILKTIYTEDQHRSNENSLDEMLVLNSFENRKHDTTYFKLLES